MPVSSTAVQLFKVNCNKC